MSPRMTMSSWTTGLLAALALVGCGGGETGAGGGGGAGGSGGGSPAPPLLESCETICEKETALDCVQFTLDQCKQQCPFLEQNAPTDCLNEYKAVYGCQASLEYVCMEMQITVTDAASCTDESLAYSECSQKIPCKKYCKAAAATSCGPKDEDACVTQCLAETSYQGGISDCSSELAYLRQCQGGTDATHLECQGGAMITVGCDPAVADYADCIYYAENDRCESFCAAAEIVGCTPDGIETCLLDCQEAAHAGSGSCDFYYDDLLRCRTEAGIKCPGGTVSDADCPEQLMSYESCVGP